MAASDDLDRWQNLLIPKNEDKELSALEPRGPSEACLDWYKARSYCRNIMVLYNVGENGNRDLFEFQSIISTRKL